MYTVMLLSSAQKEFDLLEKKYQDKVIESLRALAEDPHIGKKLGGELDGQYSIKAWPYRVVYEIRKKQIIVVVLSIKHRKDAYR